eukprot:TRINITY_DN1581_c0_g2_i1.p1 TRINITY_DN1581_c0_g2~~TRINITY_DN1581_c0_g2_i1.p1  ORF type:complete len:277 (-),score=50.77 TRINITY_DN1581_c0_g2_i1:130-960(-)
MWLNRQKPEVVSIFQNILGAKNLRVTRDRWGILRPTRNIRFKDGSVHDKPEWKTVSKWLHWDQNPWTETSIRRFQGMFTLTDHTETSGGFLCVPKFHKRFCQWAQDHPVDTVEGASLAHSLVFVPTEDPVQLEVQKIMMRAGSLLIWDSRLPHQNFPNDDDKFRIVQYITYHPLTVEQEQSDQEMLFKMIKCALIPPNFLYLLSDLGQKVLGLRRWSGNENIDIEGLLNQSTERDVEALRLYREAVRKEGQGQFMEAVKYYSKAYKLNPDLEAVMS